MPENTTTFNQGGQTVGNQTNVGSVAGDLNIGHIGAQTSQAEMSKTIAAMKAELAGLQGIPPDVRAQLNDALDSASNVNPSPQHENVKLKLDNAGKALSGVAAQLEGTDDVAQKAFKLAKTVFSIGKWVIAAVAL
ncbi:MAG: hypothetical protein ACLPXB_08045 [Thiobacillaceae bacterium]